LKAPLTAQNLGTYIKYCTLPLHITAMVVLWMAGN